MSTCICPARKGVRKCRVPGIRQETGDLFCQREHDLGVLLQDALAESVGDVSVLDVQGEPAITDAVVFLRLATERRWTILPPPRRKAPSA